MLLYGLLLTLSLAARFPPGLFESMLSRKDATIEPFLLLFRLLVLFIPEFKVGPSMPFYVERIDALNRRLFLSEAFFSNFR